MYQNSYGGDPLPNTYPCITQQINGYSPSNQGYAAHGTPIHHQQIAAAGLPGRAVYAPEEIQPGEVAMNGSISYFPSRDGSAIYAKQWLPNGTIRTLIYRPESAPEEKREATAEEQILDRLSRIEKLLTPKKASSRKEQEE